jgi:8-oxo-dGTP pyrophosphatase MutT (NUDIX family)
MATVSMTLQQSAAIPLMKGQVCLVTSRNGKRWVIPKGCLETGKTASEIALQEAWEEAGIVGVLQPEPVGSYLYDKNGITCHVLVFLLHVTEVRDEYPEHGARERCWVSPTEAMTRIEERGLREIVRGALPLRIA